VDGRPSAAFVHQANMSTRRYRLDEPEKEFRERAIAEFGADHVQWSTEEKEER